MASVAVDFKTVFTDTPWYACIGTILRWVDVAQSEIYRSLPDSSVAEEVFQMYERASVMRAHVLELSVDSSTWERLIGVSGMARVRPSLARIGRTSWIVTTVVETPDGQQIARVQTTMVAVDFADTSKPVPVPHAEVLKEVVIPAPTLIAPEVAERPPSAFVWRTEVRQSDCDTLQHINNAVYGNLAEDARRAGAAAGALPAQDRGAGSRLARTVSVDYLGQPKAGDWLEVAVWWDLQHHAVCCEFSSDNGVVVARVIMSFMDKSSL